MKLVITILCMAALTGIAASAGSAAVPMEKRVAALEHQVKVLNKEVKVLKAQVKLLRGTLDSTQQDIQDAVGTEKLRDLCLAVGVEDLLQSTWTNVDQRLTTGPAFGPQQLGWDPACGTFGVTRPGISTQPTVGFFGALIAAFIG